MKEVKVEVYEFLELDASARKKAMEEWYEHEDYEYLEELLTEYCKDLLKQKGVSYNDDLNLSYSLSYSQGDGLNFTGTFGWKKYDIEITHTWRYPFASASDIIITQDGEEIDDVKITEQFKNIYLDICKRLEKDGYAQIEYRMTEEEFADICEINGIGFLKDGSLTDLQT